ncbi:TIGR02234 family membrane protein [Streptomyces pathocidini]|uniref:TIGR02234 family membrane protein n=1 Tax=Streptomyces pathocidini TaxID=1650571 RepID=A0ABW7UYX0_9ACTN
MSSVSRGLSSPRSSTAGKAPAAAAGEGRGGGAAARGGRGSIGIALLLGAVGAAVSLVAGGQTWAEGASSAAQGAIPVAAGGRDVTGLPAALAIVGLAALVAVFAVRRIGRAAVAALLALSGAGAVLTSVLGASDTAALRTEAAKATGLARAGVEHVTYTAWPWVSAAGGALLLLAGLVALRHGANWPAMSGRYERGAAPARTRTGKGAPVDPDRPEEMWKALDRGEDPTRGS